MAISDIQFLEDRIRIFYDLGGKGRIEDLTRTTDIPYSSINDIPEYTPDAAKSSGRKDGSGNSWREEIYIPKADRTILLFFHSYTEKTQQHFLLSDPPEGPFQKRPGDTNEQEMQGPFLRQLRKYIIQYKERSSGPQCNNDGSLAVESEKYPNEEILKRNSLISTGSCNNTTYPGCEDCGGSHLIEFKVEPYSEERAKELGIDYIHQLKRNKNRITSKSLTFYAILPPKTD